MLSQRTSAVNQQIGNHSASITMNENVMRPSVVVGCKCTLQLNNNNKCIAGGISDEFKFDFFGCIRFFLSLPFVHYYAMKNQDSWLQPFQQTKPYDLCLSWQYRAWPMCIIIWRWHYILWLMNGGVLCFSLMPIKNCNVVVVVAKERFWIRCVHCTYLWDRSIVSVRSLTL